MRSQGCSSDMQRVISSAFIAIIGCSVGDADGDETAAGGPTTTAPTTSTSATTDDASSEGGESSSGDDPDEPPPPLQCAPPLVACGGACVDLASDPSNCGQCGVVCVASNANAACAAGVCAMDTCDPGFADCDGNPASGCEHTIDCVEGGPCPSSCGTTGATVCANACAPACTPPAESCNLADDNCDGVCDDGQLQGCRVGVHRMYGSNGHFYTTNAGEAAAAGHEMVAENYFYVYAAAHGDLIPLHRCIKPNTGGRRFLSQSANCEGLGAPEVTLGYMSPDADCGAFPFYRLYAPSVDFHFFTTSAVEADNAVANFGYENYGTQGLVFGGA